MREQMLPGECIYSTDFYSNAALCSFGLYARQAFWQHKGKLIGLAKGMIHQSL